MSSLAERTPINSLYQDAKASMLGKTRKCQAMTSNREAMLYSGMRANMNLPHPIYIDSGKGAILIDIDGNEYIDTCMGFGVGVLGHQHPDVQEAIQRVSKRGWHFGIHSREQIELAELLHDAIPCGERILFCNTGSESTAYAMRAARAFTGKEKVAIFNGYWHGMHDYCMIDPTREGNSPRPVGKSISSGVPQAINDLIVPLPYRESVALDVIWENKDDLAVVLIEPVQHSNPQKNVGEFLASVQEICRKSNVLFLMDEMVTGFRLAYGGGQEYFGMKADLATLGKACGGGLPIGVIAGREDIMRMFLPDEGHQTVFTGGTFSGNPLTMAAGTAAVRYLHDHPEVYARMAEQGDRLTAAINEFSRQNNYPVQVTNVGSMFHIYFQRGSFRSTFDIDESAFTQAQRAFFMHALDLGVLISGGNRYYLSIAHTPEIVDRMIEVFKESMRRVDKDGLFSL